MQETLSVVKDMNPAVAITLILATSFTVCYLVTIAANKDYKVYAGESDNKQIFAITSQTLPIS